MSESGESLAVSGRIVASVFFNSVGIVGEESAEEDSFSSAARAGGLDDTAIDRRGSKTSSAKTPLGSYNAKAE